MNLREAVSSLRTLSNSAGTTSVATGIDIGSKGIRIAVTSRHGRRRTVRNILHTDLLRETDSVTSDLLNGAVFRSLEPLRLQRFEAPRECRIALPSDCVLVRTIEVNDGSEREMRETAIRECADLYLPDHDEFMIEALTMPANQGATMQPMLVVAVRESVAMAVAADLHSVGLQVVGIDAEPLMLARAACINAADPTRPLGIIDWGASGVSFVATVNRRPALIRRFRDCSGDNLLRLAAEVLGLPPEETTAVLHGCGVDSRTGTDPSTAASRRIIHRALRPTLDEFQSEYSRTIGFLRHHLPNALPTRIVLCGGVMSFPGMKELVGRMDSVPVELWRPEACPGNREDAAFCSAITLASGGAA